MGSVRFLILGDSAITVEFGNEINIETNAKVNALFQALLTKPVEGVVEMVPTYRSLTIHYSPLTLRYDQMVEECRSRLTMEQDQSAEKTATRVLEIPVLYGGEIGVDLEDVASYHNKTPQEIIDVHTGFLHRIYMIGFWPGMPYMDAPNGLTIPRRSSPRLNVQQGAVIIQSTQTNILPNDTPTGWHILGHTPVKAFDIKRKNTSLFEPGDWIQFVSVTKESYDIVKKQVEDGTYQVKISEKEV